MIKMFLFLFIFVCVFPVVMYGKKKSQARSFEKSELKVLSFKTKLTGYYPSDSALEGGFQDRYGHKLYTLQDFLAGHAPYVSVAIDYKNEMSQYMKKYFCIPKLDKNYSVEMNSEVKRKFGGHILFKAVDTGNAFINKKWKKMDICVNGRKESYDSRLNIKATILDCNHLKTAQF